MSRMDADAPVSVGSTDHRLLNSACKELCERDARDVDEKLPLDYESVLRNIKLSFEELDSPNEVPAKLPDAVRLLSSLCKGSRIHVLSKAAVESYVDCLGALYVSAARARSSVVQRWVAHCFRRGWSLETGRNAAAPAVLEVANALRKTGDAGCDIPEAVGWVLSRSLEWTLRHRDAFSDDYAREISAAAVGLLRHHGGPSSGSLVRVLCDLVDVGQTKLEEPSTRELLEVCPPMLERLILIGTIRRCNSSSDDDDDGRGSRLLTGLAARSASSSRVFRTSLAVLFALYDASRQHRHVRQIVLQFLADVRSKVASSDWVLLFDPSLQPLILMMEAPSKGHGELLRKMHNASLRQLANEMMEDGTLDAGVLDVMLELYPHLAYEK